MIIDEVYAKYKACKELESDKMESMSVCEKWRRIERIVFYRGEWTNDP